VDIDVGQDSALLPILSTLYLLLIFHIFEKKAKNLKIPVSFLSFVDNGIFLSQDKSFKKTNSYLFCSYNVISSLLDQFGLVIEYKKSEIFYFSRSHEIFNPYLLYLGCLGDLILCPKETW